jgi:hypothetical protein
MKTGTKILIITGSVLTLGGIGLATWLLLRNKDKGDTGTSGKNKQTSLLGTEKKGSSGVSYKFVDAGKEGTTPMAGEMLYALTDGKLNWRNYASVGKKNYKEWTTDIKMGQELGVIQKVTGNCIFMKDATLDKNDECIKRGDINAGKIGVLRDKNDNPTTLQKTERQNSVSAILDFATSDDGKELGKIIASAVTKE